MIQKTLPKVDFNLALRLLAPYFSVVIFWIFLHNAWLALLGYHLQIILWSKKSPFTNPLPNNNKDLILSLSMLVAGPFIYFVLPLITPVILSGWLAQYQLTDWVWLIMIPYFGIIHPFLEQAHWGPLREKTPAAHFFFAGYHALVLYSLLPLPWLAVSFIVLSAASFIWQQIAKSSSSFSAPVLSHILADFGVVVAVWLLLQ